MGFRCISNDALGVSEGPATSVPLGCGVHPPANCRDYVPVGAVVGGEPDDPAPGKPLREPEQVSHAGAPEPVDGLVVVARHSDVAVNPSQPAQDSQLDYPQSTGEMRVVAG